MFEVLTILVVFLLIFLLYWVGKISFILQKSLNEIIKGMNSLDERLSQIEEAIRSQS